MKTISLIIQISYGVIQGYTLCFIKNCTPNYENDCRIALKSTHVLVLCGLLTFGIVVMVTVINIRVDGSPVLVYVYNNDSLTSASVLAKFDDVYNKEPGNFTAPYYNRFTNDCFVFALTYDAVDRTVKFDYSLNYLDLFGNLICRGSSGVDDDSKPGPVYLDKDWKASLLREWEERGDNAITGLTSCITFKGIFQNGSVPCSLDATCKESSRDRGTS
eukprot:m.157241 g.157241  ORF g.157241 m.157241 type:complete len:217 (+) comp38707_c0_seq9:1667-2317(+)